MTSPSPFFRQHHGLEPPAIDFGQWRPYWRVRTRLDRLLLDGAITPHEWRTAVRLRRIIEAARAAVLPIHRLDGEPRGGVSGPALTRRVDAIARLDQVRAGLGVIALGLLEACLADDCSWRYLGDRLGIDPKTARAWTIAALRALAIAKTDGKYARAIREVEHAQTGDLCAGASGL
jgi:hypothetical protein